MSEPQEIIALENNALLGAVADLFAQGFRLVQIGCTTLENAYELNYSFDKDYQFKNLRITVQPEDEIQSISVIYPNAFLYENEIHDLFGLHIKNISVDYKGAFYRTAIKTPFSIENLPKPEAPKQPQDAAKQPAAGQQQTEAPEQQPEIPRPQKETTE